MYDFDDRYMRVGDGRSAAASSLAASDLADTNELPRLGRLAFEPILATDIVDAWLEGYFGRLPREVRAQVLGGAAERIASGFSSLEWAATKDVEGRSERSMVATPDGVEFSEAQARVAVDVANDAIFAVLDDEVGLARDEAENIIAARPIADMAALAAVPQVGRSALTKLRDYAGEAATVESARRVLCPSYDWATGQAHATDTVALIGAYGQWTLTVIDLGDRRPGRARGEQEGMP